MYDNLALNIASHFPWVYFMYKQYESYTDRRLLMRQCIILMLVLIVTEFGGVLSYMGMGDNVNGLVIILFQIFFFIGSGIMVLKELNAAIYITTFNGLAIALPGRIVGNIMCLYASDISNPFRLIIAVIVSLGFHILVMYFILKYIGKFFESIKRDKDFPWTILIMIPIFYYVIVYLLMNFPMNFQDQPMNMAVAEVVSLLVIFVYLLIIQTIKYQKNNSQLYYNNQEYELMIDQMRGRIEVAADKQQQAAVMRHDQRHVNNVVRQLIEEGQMETAVAVLDTHDEEMDALAAQVFCKNIIINSVIEFSAARCKALNIDLIVQADIPEELSVPDLELAMVVSNMLENAIHATDAVKNGREIEFISMKKGDRQIIQISNPYLGKVDFDEESHIPLSSQGEGHGLGMQSIKIFVEKHGALFDCQEEDGKFIARLLLQGDEEEEEDELVLFD